MHWIVAYDVAKDLARTRVARSLERAGLRVQKSVFLVDLPPREVRQLLAKVKRLVDSNTDQVDAWPLAANWDAHHVHLNAVASTAIRPTIVW
jgi:CRISPR-associated endonuclease Cas2